MLDVRHSVYTNRISNRSILFRIQAMTLVLEYPQLFCKFFAENLKKKTLFMSLTRAVKPLTLHKKSISIRKPKRLLY